jgi:hypothetical protein
VTHILRPGKASEKSPKGVIPPSLCEISQNASRKNQNYSRWDYNTHFDNLNRIRSALDSGFLTCMRYSTSALVVSKLIRSS